MVMPAKRALKHILDILDDHGILTYDSALRFVEEVGGES